MKKTYLLLSIGAGLVGGLLSSALRPIAAQAQSQALDEIKAGHPGCLSGIRRTQDHCHAGEVNKSQ